MIYRLITTFILLTAAVMAETVLPPPVPRAAIDRSREEALAFLRGARNPDGSFGVRQRRLQTGLVVLAFLSQGMTTADGAESPVPGAIRWLIANTPEDGFLGDEEYPMESNAVAVLALGESLGMLEDPELARQAAQRTATALDYTLNLQDKAAGADYYGGWKATPKSKANDRRVTAWYLLALRSMQLRGYEVHDRALVRALDFLEGSQKVPGAGQFPREDRGGFSYDAAGLPVVTITGAGLAIMSIYGRDVKRRDLALDWLARNRPIWYGPNFYDAYFFAARAYSRERWRGTGPETQARAFMTRVWELLREHQNPDGSFQVPPGNAENTQEMGKTYATAMAVLILNAGRDLMPVDATD